MFHVSRNVFRPQTSLSSGCLRWEVVDAVLFSPSCEVALVGGGCLFANCASNSFDVEGGSISIIDCNSR